MPKIVLLGAGQMGEAAAALLNETEYELAAFGDNKLTGLLAGKPILPVAQALALEPEVVLIAVAGREREQELAAQVQKLGFQGSIRLLSDFSRSLDIRKAVLWRLAARLEQVPGAVAELGVYRGDFARVLNRFFPRRTLYLFDTFSGFTAADLQVEQAGRYSGAGTGDFADTQVDLVLNRLPYPEQAQIYRGRFPDTVSGLEENFALVSLDVDLYAPTLAGLNWFWPRLNKGGALLLHDWASRRFKGVGAALEAFEQDRGPLALCPVGDLHGTAVLLKT